MSVPKLQRDGPWQVAAALALILIGSAFVIGHERRDAASVDEPIHILASYRQVVAGDGSVNLEHPPLVKFLVGSGLALVIPRLAEPAGRSGVVSYVESLGTAHRFLFGNRASPDAILLAARLPMLAFFVGTCLLVFSIARHRAGAAAAFGALGLSAFEPTILAHAGVVQTDLPVAMFWLGAVAAWNSVLVRRTPGRLLAAGLLFGAALSTKYSAVFLLPTFVLLALCFRASFLRRSGLTGVGRSLARDAASLAMVVGLGAAVVFVVSAVAMRQTTASTLRSALAARLFIPGGGSLPGSGTVDVMRLGRPFGSWLGGLIVVLRTNAEPGVTYFLGAVRESTSALYFPVAFFAKATPPFLLAALGAAVVFSVRRRRRDLWLWVPVVYYFFFSASAGYNIGVRHLLPIFPFLAIAGAEAAAAIGRRLSASAGAATAAGLLVLCQLGIAARTAPFFLSYFSPFVGGHDGGERILADSNLDWGLDLRRLDDEFRRRGIRDPTVAYFGGDDVWYRLRVPDFLAIPVIRGRFVAVSETLWAEGPEYLSASGRPDLGEAVARLRDELAHSARRVGRVGGSIDIFDLGMSSRSDKGVR